MKTLTTREFYHAPALARSLRPGQSLLVTDKGKPNLIVTKAGKRGVKTRADLVRDASQISPKSGPKVDFTAAMRELKK